MPHGANGLAYIDFLHLDDIMTFDKTLPPHPYKECEALAHGALSQHDSELRQMCNKNLGTLQGPTPNVDMVPNHVVDSSIVLEERPTSCADPHIKNGPLGGLNSPHNMAATL